MARHLAAGAYDTTNGFVMAGGIEDIQSADRTSDGSSIGTFTPLPVGIDRHCLVALDNGGDLFMTGGYSTQTGGYSNKAYILRSSSSTWVEQPDMPTPREGKKRNASSKQEIFCTEF